MGEHYFEPSNRHWEDFGGVPCLKVQELQTVWKSFEKLEQQRKISLEVVQKML